MKIRALAAAMLMVAVASPMAAGQPNTVSQARLAQLGQMRGVRGPVVALVDPGVLRNSRAGASVPLRLGQSMQLSARTTENTTLPEGRALWRGRIPSTGGAPEGEAIIVTDGADVTGTVHAPDGRVFKLRPLDGATVATEIDYATMPADEPGDMAIGPGGGGAADASADATVTIDLLVAYTNAARTAPGVSIDSLIDLAVAESNTGFANSGVNARFRVVHRMQVTYNESTRTYDQINADETSGAIPGLQAARDSSGADVVVLIVNRGDYCGRAANIGGGASTAYVAVHYDCATGYYSFAHEVGHIAGARHDLAQDSSTSPYAYGHGFNYPAAAPNGWRTIMSYACSGTPCNPRINYWSNVTQTYGGRAMGSAASQNNARVWNERAATMAAWRSPAAASWEGLGGVITTNVSCTTWSANRIDCFARGTDNAMWHRWWNGSAWGGWESLGGVITTDPNCVSWGSNRIDCFARGTDNAMYHRWWNGSAWGGWESLGGVITGTPECVSWSSNRIDCFARGSDNAMHHRWWNGSAWGGWESLGGVITSEISCTTWSANRIDCFARGTDNAMYHRWWNGSAWGGWESLGGVITTRPECVSWSANRIDCFARGTDNAMYHRWWNGSSWGGWESLGGVITTEISCSSWSANRIDCFARGTDNAMYHRWWNGSAWGGWENQGGVITTRPECVSWSSNRIDCFARGTDNAMYHRWWNGSAWGP